MKTLDRNIMSALKKRDENSNKKDNGTLLAVCGSKRYRGAAVLAALGGMRTGVGLYRAASPESVLVPLNIRLPEAVLLPMDEAADGTISASNISELLSYAEKSTAILCGCGLGISDDTGILVSELIKQTKIPIVLDADALNIISEDKSILEYAYGRCIVTPHFGEMSRLIGEDYDSVSSRPAQIASDFAKKYGCVTILKGSSVYIASPDGGLSVYSNPNSGLAKGGSGDLLAGMIASLAAQGNRLVTAAEAGVYIHGEAAQNTAERLSHESMLATDVADDMYKVFTEAHNENNP